MSNPWHRFVKRLKRLIVGDGQHRRVPLEEWPPDGEIDSTPPGPACEGTLIDGPYSRVRPYLAHRRPGRDVRIAAILAYYREADRRARGLS